MTRPSSARRRIILATGLLVAMFPETGFARTISYKIARGDTLVSITQRYLLPGITWRRLRQLNRITEPRRLRIGSTLKVPDAWLRHDPQSAQLSAFRGNVRVSVQDRVRVPEVGMRLPERSLIRTQQQSFASLTLPDGSILSVQPATTVRIATLGRVRMTGGLVRNFDVETGAVRSTVTPAGSPEDQFIIRTPLANASVRGTEFRVVSTPNHGGGRIEVLKGVVAINDKAILTAGHGIKVDHTGPGIPQALQAAPELVRPGRIQDGEDMVFSVKPQDGATRWHLLVASDAGFVEELSEVSTQEPEARMEPLPDGTYYLRVTAISEDGLEGLPRDYAFRRERYSLDAGYSLQKGNGAAPTYLFRWQRPPSGKGRFRFVMRSSDPQAPAIIDEPGLETTDFAVRALPPGTYHWKVGRWVEEDGQPVLIWDDDHELIIAN